jgi:hypothetical protein
MSVEFNTGTLGAVKLEIGAIPTPFVMRPYDQELLTCRRYYEKLGAGVLCFCGSTTAITVQYRYAGAKRSSAAILGLKSNPAIFMTNAGYVSGAGSVYSTGGGAGDPTGFSVNITGFTGLPGPGYVGFINDVDIISADARF